MKNILDLLIDDFHERGLPELMPRPQSMAWVSGKANVVIGMRRSGKTLLSANAGITGKRT